MGSICHSGVATLLTKNHLRTNLMATMMMVMTMMMMTAMMVMTMMMVTAMVRKMMVMTSIEASFVSSEAAVGEIIIGTRLAHKFKQIFYHLDFFYRYVIIVTVIFWPAWF